MISAIVNTSLVPWSPTEFYSIDLCITLIRYRETTTEYALGRAHRIAVQRSVDLAWIASNAAWDRTETHICVCCRRDIVTTLAGPLGTICYGCFEILLRVHTREHRGIINLGAVCEVISHGADIILVYDRGKQLLSTWEARRVFGCHWCLLGMLKKYNGILQDYSVHYDELGDRMGDRPCVVCGSTDPSSTIQCRDNSYEYCYECYVRGLMCIRALTTKYLVISERIGVCDVSKIIMCMLLEYVDGFIGGP